MNVNDDLLMQLKSGYLFCLSLCRLFYSTYKFNMPKKSFLVLTSQLLAVKNNNCNKNSRNFYTIVSQEALFLHFTPLLFLSQKKLIREIFLGQKKNIMLNCDFQLFLYIFPSLYFANKFLEFLESLLSHVKVIFSFRQTNSNKKVKFALFYSIQNKSIFAQ